MAGLGDQLDLGIPSPPFIELCVGHHAHPLGCHACLVSAFAEPFPQLLEDRGCDALGKHSQGRDASISIKTLSTPCRTVIQGMQGT